jgi:LEA14-like dessication related protein
MYMSPSRKYLVVLLLGTLLSGGCAVLLGQQLAPPRVWLTDIRVTSLEVPRQRYQIALRIQNPNPVPLPGRGLSLDLALGGVHLAHVVSNASIPLAELGEVQLELEITGHQLELAERVQSVQRGIQVTPYRIEGQIVLANDVPPQPFWTEGVLGTAPVRQTGERASTYTSGD